MRKLTHTVLTMCMSGICSYCLFAFVGGGGLYFALFFTTTKHRNPTTTLGRYGCIRGVAYTPGQCL